MIIGTYPTIIVNGAPEDATVVMSLFAWIQSQVNGNAAPATSGLSLLKGDGIGGTTQAIPGVDYAAVGAGVPVGTIIDYAGNVLPPGYLWCDGTTLDTTTYALLYAAIGNLYGGVVPPGQFNLPDLRGRGSIGYGAGPGLTNRALATHLGEETHALTLAEIGGTATALTGATVTVAGITAATAHNNMHPVVVVNKIIFAGFGIGAGGVGAVTSVSVVTANGFGGTVANPTSTPAITLTTTVTGVLKGDGTSISAATGADFPAMTNVAGGAVPTPPNDATLYLNGTGVFTGPPGSATQDFATKNLSVTGNVALLGAARRIQGDWSTAVLSDRTAIQSSVTNGNTGFTVCPNGTSITAAIDIHSDSALTNSSRARYYVQGNQSVGIQSTSTGTGTILPLWLQIGPSAALVCATDLSVSVATTIKTNTYAVGSLPTGVAGARAMVNNALGPIFGSTVVAGGAVTVPVFYDGAAWKVG